MDSAKYTGRLKEILERKEKRKEILEKELLFLVKQLIKFGAKKIVLFGSLRENKIDFNSDIDLLVIMPSSKPGKEWMSFLYENLERNVASDLITFNETEFAKELEYNSFLRNIIKRGKVLHEA